MRRYEVTFTTVVSVTVLDDEIVDRCQADDWKALFYDLDEHGAVEMLALSGGIDRRPLSALDGWADVAEGQVLFATNVVDATVQRLEGGEGREVATRFYGKKPCRLCGELVSGAGVAQYTHRKKHKREGLIDERGSLTEAGRMVLANGHAEGKGAAK